MSDNGIVMYGTAWCSDCKSAKKFFGEHRVPYTFIDIDENPDQAHVVEEANDGKRVIPTIFFEDKSVLIEPSNAELATKLGLHTKPTCPFYDLVIVGGGPTGLTAALYAAREGIETLVIDRGSMGGQAGITERLDNYPGFPEGISGAEFAERVVQQCRRFGVELLSAAEVTSIRRDGQYLDVVFADNTNVRSHTVLLAPGSTYRRLNVPGEEDFIGAGVHFCATCDGPFYRDRPVLVVGGGNSAVEEADFLTRFASSVTIVARGKELTASEVARTKAAQSDKIDVQYRTAVTSFNGDGKLRSVTLKDLDSGEEEEINPAGVFVFVGLKPNTEFIKGTIDLNENGFITTTMAMETNIEGVFAAGDARAGSTKQLVSAAGEGATAALMIRQYLRARGDVMDQSLVEQDAA
jgi:thioredoxin reductase (NADPH)